MLALPFGQLRLLHLPVGPVPALEQAVELDHQLGVCLVERDVRRPQLLFLRERIARLPDAGDDRDIPADIELHIRLRRGHFAPHLQHLEQVEIDRDDEVGKAHDRPFERRHLRREAGADERQILHRPDVAPVVDAVASGPSGDLLDLRRTQGAPLPAVELLGVHEDHAADGQIQPHADRVGGHDVLHPPGQKPLHLPPPRRVGQRPVDDGRLLPLRPQILRDAQNADL